MKDNHTPIRAWASGFMTAAFISTAIAAYSFATNRLAYNPDVLVVSSLDRESCANAQDEVDCLMRVASSTTQQERK